MNSYSMRYVHLHGDGDSLDTDALCPKNVYQHSLSSLCTLAKMAQQNVNFQKKQKFRHKKQKYFFLRRLFRKSYQCPNHQNSNVQLRLGMIGNMLTFFQVRSSVS